MKNFLHTLCLPALLAGSISVQAQAFYNFENSQELQGWNINDGSLSISADKQKLGKHALHIKGAPGSIITIENARGLQQASRSRKGGITAWIYNDKPVDASLVFRFTDGNGKEVCRQGFRLAFQGWR